MALRLKEGLHMRADGGRVVVYQKATHDSPSYPESFGWRLLHPNVAIMISLMDGAKDLDRVAREFGFLHGNDSSGARRFIDTFVTEHRDFFEDVTLESEPTPRFDPFDFLLPQDGVDLSMERLHQPIGCVWVVTLACGFKCSYCYADIDRVTDGGRGIMTLDQIDRMMDQFDELEMGRVGVSGGDPFAHPHVFEILSRLYERGYIMEVPTKTALSRRALERVRDIGLTSVQFSLDSPLRGDVVASHLQTVDEGHLQRVLASIDYARELEMRIAINAVLTTKNIDHVPDMVRYYGDLGHVYRLNLSQVGGAIYRSFPDLMASPEAYRELEAELAELVLQYPHMQTSMSWIPEPSLVSTTEKEEWFATRPRCSGGRWEFAIMPDGSMTVCEELYYHPHFLVGNVLETPIAELWNSERMLSILYPESSDILAGPCAGCDDLEACNREKGRCWVRALKAFHDRPGAENWPDPFCPMAPASLHRVG